MAQRTVIGKNVWLFIQSGATTIPIKCLTTHTITASQEISNTETKCGRKKSPQGDPDYQITGEGQIILLDGADVASNYSAAKLFELMAAQTLVDVVSGPASGTPQPGDTTFTGKGYISELEQTYPAGEESTYSFTIDIDGPLTQEVEPSTP